MTNEIEGDAAYTMGYSEEFRQLLDRRSAAIHAQHLLPHLKSGMKLLDFGCGPGNISVGLAERISPGEFHGIDMEESQIELARAAARDGGHQNMAFHVGNVYELPLEDRTFDVAHCHAVLMHVPDTQAALAEVKRVLKPGGIISSRESIVASSFLEPQPPEITDAWGVFSKLVQGNGGHPDFGRELKRALLDAGFADISTSASFDSFSSPADVAFLHGFISDWFFSPVVIAALTNYGLATQEQIDDLARTCWTTGETILGHLEPSPSVRQSPLNPEFPPRSDSSGFLIYWPCLIYEWVPDLLA